MEFSDAPAFKPSRDGVLVLSGNRLAIRVNNGVLKLSSGTGGELSYSRGVCPLRVLVVTRPTGYVSFAALEWLRDKGVSLVQLDWTGAPVFTACSARVDQPELRRSQIAAAGNAQGRAIMRALLTAKIRGQEHVLRGVGEPRSLPLPSGDKTAISFQTGPIPPPHIGQCGDLCR